jgi:hypothetical protein
MLVSIEPGAIKVRSPTAAPANYSTITRLPSSSGCYNAGMTKSQTATREDIDDVLNVLDVMMIKIDDRFNKGEANHAELHRQVQNILNHLDSWEKRLEISEDERLVMAHQLT